MVWKSLEGRACSLHGWIHSRGLPFPPFLSPFLSFFFPRRSQRERERELFRDTAYYNGPPREYRASRGEPLEDVFENARGLGFLSKLKTNSSHLCHRWHNNNHLCLPLLLPIRFPLFLESFCLFFSSSQGFYHRKNRVIKILCTSRRVRII